MPPIRIQNHKPYCYKTEARPNSIGRKYQNDWEEKKIKLQLCVFKNLINFTLELIESSLNIVELLRSIFRPFFTDKG